MPALSFQGFFEDALIEGAKKMTIRKVRKHPIKVGDTLHFFTGARTKPRKLGTAICTKVIRIEIFQTDFAWSVFLYDGQDGRRRELTAEEVESLAKKDDFLSGSAFYKFFERNYGQKFLGVILGWEELCPATSGKEG